MFSEGGAYNIGYEENVTCHGLVLNILALHLTQHMMETVRLKFIRRIMTELKMRFRYCYPQHSYQEAHHFGHYVTAT